MKIRQTSFDMVSLHDAKITRIQRDVGSIFISLSFAFLSQEHPCNPLADDSLVCLSPLLHFLNVEREQVRIWDDGSKKWKLHPDPQGPLDNEIMESGLRDGAFFLDGFHRVGWSEWQIWSDAYMLTWDQSHSYHNKQ